RAMITRPASSPSLSAAASWVAASRSVRVGPHASGVGSGSVLGAGAAVSGSGSCGSSGIRGPPGVHAARRSPVATARAAGRWWRIGASFTTRNGLLHHREGFRCDLPAFAVTDAYEAGDGVRAEVAGFRQDAVADLPACSDGADGAAEIRLPAPLLPRLSRLSLPD